MNIPDDFTFSQSSLQDYVDCARRFQLRYMERLRWPAVESEPALEHERHMQMGQQFHHLIHQHVLGIPAERLAQQIDDPTLREWWAAYLRWGLADVPQNRFPEITLSAPLGEYRLLAKIDLLAVEPGQRALIVDWKTLTPGRTAPSPERLMQRLQTVVYRCVLALAGADFNGGKVIPPEQIEMVYWYTTGEMVWLPYDELLFERDKDYLLQLMEALDSRETFPLTEDSYKCAFCTYRSLCDRGGEAGQLDDLLDFAEMTSPDEIGVNFEQIAEIEF
jgi:hypothetical protein